MSVIAPELVTAILDRAPVGRLVLCDLGDRPQGLPFVFARVDDAIYSPIDGKPKRHAELSRLAWIERRPDASVIVDHYEADWSRLWWLRLGGEAAVIHDGHLSWEQAVSALARKYPQYCDTAMFQGEPTMVRFAWSQAKSWAADKEHGIDAWLGNDPARGD